jgi:hypothetical protein
LSRVPSIDDVVTSDVASTIPMLVCVALLWIFSRFSVFFVRDRVVVCPISDDKIVGEVEKWFRCCSLGDHDRMLSDTSVYLLGLRWLGDLGIAVLA